MKNKFAALSLLPALAAAQGAFAAEFVLEETIVTAQKRSQSAQQVPIAITALSGDFIERKNVLSVTDLEKFSPGLRIPQQDSSKTFIRIRGVGSRKFDVGSEGSVGVFIDEIYSPRFSGADIGILDVERIEVLKGPQGTLFGRNTAAGAISITTRKPTQETEGFFEAGAGNKDSYVLRGSLSGAVSDELSMRLSLGQNESGGINENTNTGTTDDRTTSIARLQALFEPGDSWSVLGSVQYAKREQAALLQKSLPATDGTIIPLFVSPVIAATANDDFRSYPVTHDGDYDNDTLSASLRIETELGELSLVSITSYQDNEGTVTQDFDGSDIDIGMTRFVEESDTFSQEFRVLGENWLAGVYYYADNAFSTYEFSWELESLQGLVLGGRPDINDNAPIDIETASWAVFGEYTFDFGEQLSLTLGARYSDDEKDFALAGETNAPGLPAVVAPYTYADKKSWDSLDPKVALTYQVHDDVMTFLTYSEGYKAGGIQFTAINLALAEEIFDPEELSSWEVGFKSDLLDNTLRLNASAFFYDYQDLQVQRVDLVKSGGLPAAFTSNAAESEIKGLEVEINWLPAAGLDLRLAYAYLDAQYQDFTGTAGEDYSGNPLPASPENTVIFSAEYITTLPGDWLVSVGTDWTWVDDYNFDVVDDDPFTKGGDFTLGGARLALVSPDEMWSVAAFVQNLTDEEYYSQATRRGSEIIASTGDGRRYGVRVRYNF